MKRVQYMYNTFLFKSMYILMNFFKNIFENNTYVSMGTPKL